MRTRTTYQTPAPTAGQMFRSTFRNALTGGLVVAAALIALVGIHPAYEAPTVTQSTYWQGGPGFTVEGNIAPIVRDGYSVR